MSSFPTNLGLSGWCGAIICTGSRTRVIARHVRSGCRLTRSSRQSRQCVSKQEFVVEEWITILKAADAAARWHAHQKRKGAAQEPYINHLLEVASLVAEATGGRDANLVVAALLHDAIEDQEVPREMIAQAFGDDVASLVEECTDDKSLEKQERKRLQVKNAPKKSDRAKVIKLA